mmetsp:Transcript_141171/g.451238  ORF Transcript_141171/g.451238 Transcript_141171/m.451238 type:complete len:111 (-) Transcript_141171:183-515(-)
MLLQIEATTPHRGCAVLHTTRAAAAVKTTTHPRMAAVHGDSVLATNSGKAISHAVMPLQIEATMPHRGCAELHTTRAATAVETKQHPFMVAFHGQQGWATISDARQSPMC